MYRSTSTARKGSVARSRARWQDEVMPAITAKGVKVERGIRAGLVAKVRGQIAAGTYDTPERWEAALDRLADSLGV